MTHTYTADVTPVFEAGSNYSDGVDRGRIEVAIPCNWRDADGLRRQLRARLTETTRHDADGRLLCTLRGTISTTTSWARFVAAAERAGVDVHYRTGDLEAVLAAMRPTR